MTPGQQRELTILPGSKQTRSALGTHETAVLDAQRPPFMAADLGWLPKAWRACDKGGQCPAGQGHCDPHQVVDLGGRLHLRRPERPPVPAWSGTCSKTATQAGWWFAAVPGGTGTEPLPCGYFRRVIGLPAGEASYSLCQRASAIRHRAQVGVRDCGPRWGGNYSGLRYGVSTNRKGTGHHVSEAILNNLGNPRLSEPWSVSNAGDDRAGFLGG